MARADEVVRSVGRRVSDVVSGVGALVGLPLVLRPLRPVTKQLVKGSLQLVHGANYVVRTTREEWSALVNEAQTEVGARAAPPKSEQPGATRPGGKQRARKHKKRKKAAADPSAGELTRIKGVGEEYAELLRAAGVDTLAALARQTPGGLNDLLATVNERDHLVQRVPEEGRLRRWIEQAEADAKAEGEKTG